MSAFGGGKADIAPVFSKLRERCRATKQSNRTDITGHRAMQSHMTMGFNSGVGFINGMVAALWPLPPPVLRPEAAPKDLCLGRA
jgi:hypothetical protein